MSIKQTNKNKQAVADRDERLAKAKRDTKFVIKTYRDLSNTYKKERKSHLDNIASSNDSKTIKYLMQKVNHMDNNIRICEKQIKIQELCKEVEQHRYDNYQMKIGLITL
ncbi:MAG: hypothetical protein CMJ25_24995 [Phycisphaerae bacterium]|nr:hypothetical protein [Phycisphaerae bacterium]